MPYIDILKKIKNEKHLTNEEIAKISNMPLSTITRIFNGTTPNPTFETILQLSLALGTSPDEIAGIKSPAEPPPPIAAPIVATFDGFAELLKEKDQRIRDLKDEVIEVRKEKHRFAFTLGAVVALLVVLFIVDIFAGDIGFFRY